MRQYISPQALDSNGFLTIGSKDYRYLKSVLRLAAGDMIHVRFPDGLLQPMTVCRIDEKNRKIFLQVCTVTEFGQSGENQPEETQTIESCQFSLFMAVPKSSKFELIVRQATECGISRIIPVQTEFSQTGAEKMNFRSDRFERIIKEARQQSGSPVNTQIDSCIKLKDAAALWKKETEGLSEKESLALVLYERNDSTVSILEAASSIKNSEGSIKKAAVFCGSEGGLSPQEIQILQEAGFIPVHLKTNILRCETAALYGIASLQSLL